MDYPDYDPQRATDALTDDELDALDEQLRALPGDAVMNVEALDGYLTALVVGPPGLAGLRTADWLPAVWGGDGEGTAPFASGKQKKRAVVAVLRHLHAVNTALRGDAAGWQPVFSVAETPDGGEFVDAEDWCAGFLAATAMAPEAWGSLFDDPALSPALVPIATLGGDRGEDAPPLADADRDALSRAVPDAVMALREHSAR